MEKKLDKGDILNINELAEILSTTKRSIFNWIEKGEIIKPKKIGNKFIWQSKDIQAWLDSK